MSRLPDYFAASGPIKEEYNTIIYKMAAKIDYSERYKDDEYEYRHVRLPKEYTRMLPKDRLLSEAECSMLGIRQSPGWEHYLIHKPEPHVLLFRRRLPDE
jgi:cyclin-dependent kinase regulatory subunit CKS1